MCDALLILSLLCQFKFFLLLLMQSSSPAFVPSAFINKVARTVSLLITLLVLLVLVGETVISEKVTQFRQHR